MLSADPQLRQNNPYRQEWGISTATRVVLYSGNLGVKQGLDAVIDAARAFSDTDDVLFVVVGDGAFRETLQSEIDNAKLPNIRLEALQPAERLDALLALGDVHLVLQKKGAADSVFPSKLTNILACGGNALVTADPDTELGRLVRDHPGIARLSAPENTGALIETLREMLAEVDPQSREVNQVACNYAGKNLAIPG